MCISYKKRNPWGGGAICRKPGLYGSQTSEQPEKELEPRHMTHVSHDNHASLDIVPCTWFDIFLHALDKDKERLISNSNILI